MQGLWDALRRLIELLVAYLAGRQVERADNRADAAEAALDAERRAHAAADDMRDRSPDEQLRYLQERRVRRLR